MARSRREVFHFVAVNMMLYIGVVVGLNCDSTMYSGVSFCSGMGSTGRTVYLSGIDKGTDGTRCNCSIILATYTQDPVKIEIKNMTTTTNLCDYSLYYVYRNTTTRLYSCDEHFGRWGFNLKHTETVRLHMELGTRNGVGFPFCLELFSESDSQMKLQCATKSTTTTMSPTALTHTDTSIPSDGISTISNTSHSPTSSTSGNDDSSATLSTNLNSRTWRHDGASETTLASKSSDMTRSTSESQPANDDSDRLIGIIVGSIIGVLIVVALVILIVCLVKRRQKKPPYETPLEPQDRPHNLNAVVTPNNNANGYNSQITNPGNQGMTYLENDLYKSMDDDEPVGRRGGNHEGMIYLENDLYISSNETDDVNQDAENSVPHQPVEYAVVNKTAKKSSSSDGASTGHTVGPRGDE